MRLGQIHRLWRMVVDQTVQPLGLTQPRWTALMCLRHLGEGTTQKQLSEALGIELSSLSRTLDQLENQGLVRRHVNGQDRRARNVSFTPQGRDILTALDSRTRSARAELLAGLPEEELETLWTALARIEHNVWQRLEASQTGSVTGEHHGS
ncbi:transcriptional regulator SlyA [Modicisalibacter luteus]|uniref:Transcriptional regulator SlyA n=2 Tax=Modicisalibacter luteus TaxID=453962 RepID=A0ABV7LWU7_9GAMM|nr:transcriptional regulator SlyA [Halomonas lutea]